MTSSSSSAHKVLSLIPFAYFTVTRVKSLRDFAYLAASSWIPAFWLLLRLNGFGPAEAALSFVAGYLAFISAYEIGYFVNDTWDARHSSGGRARISYTFGMPYVVLFLIVRISLWLAIGQATGWLENTVWIAGYATLAIVFTQHNLAQSKGLRLASFFQLATLRFLLPIVSAVPIQSGSLIVLTAILLYTYLRFLAYIDSKGVLQLAERRDRSFGLRQLVSQVPLIVFVAYLSRSTLLVELLAYFVLVHTFWYILGATRNKVAD